MASTSALVPVSSLPVFGARSRGPATVAGAFRFREAQRWIALAIGSLLVAGLLSLSVVIGRLPVLSRLIDDPLFFKRCLVVHVDLALVVWFYAFFGGLFALATAPRREKFGAPAYVLAIGGMLALLAGALRRGAQPILANYVPVIDHPLFSVGLAMFFTGVLLHVVRGFAAPAPRRGVLPADASVGIHAAAVCLVIAAATWVSARAGLPDGLDAHTRAEFLAWGPGHVLQAGNACAMLAVWLWLLERATGAVVLAPRTAGLVFGAIVLPQAVMPLLTLHGTLDALYYHGATQLMRWTIFPVMLGLLVVGWRHLHRPATPRGARTLPQRVARVGFGASAALAVLGVGLGACIRSSTTLVPAHYHASLGAVTVAFMTAAYLVCDLVRREAEPGAGLTEAVWRRARQQLGLFGIGQSIFALGFALGGAYGLGRKAYAAEQQVHGAGEIAGLLLMGGGGLVAATAGLWFLFLLLREIRGWWRTAAATAAATAIPAADRVPPAPSFSP